MYIKQRSIYILLFAALGLCACDPKVDNRGYVSNVVWKDQLTVGKTTKDEVMTEFGSPSAKSTFGDEAWYYISERKEATAFLKPEVVQQKVVRLTFDASGVLSKIEDFDESSSKEFDYAKRVTPTEGHQLGFVEQVLGNIGRFNKEAGSSSGPPHRTSRPGY